MKTLKYLIYSLILFSTFLIICYVELKLKNISSESFRFYPWVIYRFLLYIPLGIILGMPRLFKEITQTGKWSINVPKLLILGLPALYFTFYFIFHFSFRFLSLPSYLGYLLTEISTYKVAGLLLGYVLITSFYKKTRSI